MSPHDFLDEDRDYNWYMAARFIFAGQGMSDKQRNKALHRLVDEKILEPRADKSGWQFTGEDLMAFIEKRNKRREEVRQQKVEELRTDIQELKQIMVERGKNEDKLLQELSVLSSTLKELVDLVGELKQGEDWRK